MYECVICLEINHPSRLHCQNCGTIPAKYSILQVPMVIHEDKGNNYGTGTKCVPVMIAIGAMRASQKRSFKKSHFVTMPISYYASE